MPIAIAMPKLGMTMQEGTVVEWHAAAGEAVIKGAVVLSIESEKTEIEIESPADGVLRHVYVAPGETVPCGTLLAALTSTADEAFDPEAFRSESGQPTRPPSPAPTSPAEPERSASTARTATRPSVPVTPAARKRARELGIDPTRAPGSGPGGRVTREDVDAYVAQLGSRVAVAENVMLDVPSQGSGPMVVLLPGFGTDVSAFARQVPILAERFEVRGINPRGVAGSDAPEAGVYDVATAADDVAQVLSEKAHVVGASLGAAVALELALAHPERVRSLTLITPFLRATARLRAVLDAWCRIGAEASPDTLARALLPWLFSPEYLGDDARRERTARGLAQTVARVPAATLERAAAGLLAWSGTRERDLERLSAPTVLITASADLLTPNGESTARAFTGARLVAVPGAGHAVALEAPEAVNDAILAHLSATDGG